MEVYPSQKTMITISTPNKSKSLQEETREVTFWHFHGIKQSFQMSTSKTVHIVSGSGGYRAVLHPSIPLLMLFINGKGVKEVNKMLFYDLSPYMGSDIRTSKSSRESEKETSSWMDTGHKMLQVSFLTFFSHATRSRL